MKKITFLLLFVLICCIGSLQAQESTSFMDADLSTLANNHSEAPLNRQSEIVAVHTSLVTSTFTSRAAFQAACAGLPLEDFTGGPLPGAIIGCTEISNAGSTCYPPGEIISGFVVTSSFGNVVALGTGAVGNTSDAVGADQFSSFTIITFTDPTVTSAGMDIMGFSGSTVFRVYDSVGLLTDTFTLVNPSNTENFFGVISDIPIGRIELEGTGAVGELFENFEFGSCVTNTPPTAVCQNITVQLDGSGNVTIVPAQVDGGSSDAEGPVTLSIDINTFDCTNIGANTVTLTVTDSDGVTDTCTAIVTVADDIDPVITCKADGTRDTNPGVCEYTVAGTEFDATFTDNCTGGTIINNYNGTATLDGEVLPKGVTTVMWTADDGNGQTATCTTVITVEDNEDPVITCPGDITVNNDPGICGAAVTWTAPVGVDNCS
ncbi:hypothetical protein K8089_16000, partial [Aequorivita sp. F47161]|nr:hypothetical protein [Aequorivita vitellina]